MVVGRSIKDAALISNELRNIMLGRYKVRKDMKTRTHFTNTSFAQYKREQLRMKCIIQDFKSVNKMEANTALWIVRTRNNLSIEEAMKYWMLLKKWSRRFGRKTKNDQER